MSAISGVGPVLLVDLGATTFYRDGTVMTVCVGDRLLGVCLVAAECSDSEAAFRALDEIAESSWVEVDSPYGGPGQVKARVAWLNPFTAAVSVGSAQTGRVYTDHSPVVMESDSVVGQVKFDAVHGRVLAVAGKVLPERAQPAVRELSRELASHS